MTAWQQSLPPVEPGEYEHRRDERSSVVVVYVTVDGERVRYSRNVWKNGWWRRTE